MKVGIAEAAKEFGVCQATLRRWEAKGKLEVEYTRGGFRRYDLDKLKGLGRYRHGIPGNRKTIAYARVPTSTQKGDLTRQVELLESYCAAHGWTFEVLQDLGSGMNYNKKGLQTLIKQICQGDVERLVLTHKDRLLRFGAELIFSLCEQFGCQVVIINGSEEISFEEELTQDVLEIIAVFSAKLYGKRSHKNQQVLQKLRQVAQEFDKK